MAHPPRSKPPLRSLSGPPNPCITPSTETLVVVVNLMSWSPHRTTALPERSGSRTLRQPSSLGEEGATHGGLRGTDQAGERRDLEVLGGRDERRPQGGVRRDERAHGA